MEKLKPEYIQVLDGILRMTFLLTGETNEEKRKNIQDEFQKIKDNSGVSDPIFIALNNKLMDDGYATHIDGRVIITLKGILFADTGGYSLQQKSQESELAKTRLTNILLVVGSVATALLFVWEIVKYIIENCNC